MKNKMFLLLAVAVAANAFIATPAVAFTFTLADVAKATKVTGKAALATGKAALGLTALGTASIGPAFFGTLAALSYKTGRPVLKTIFTDFGNFSAHANANNIHAFIGSPWVDLRLDMDPKFAVGAALATTLIAGYAGYNLLKSAWIDAKNINK
jgi:hypothetical protein